MFEGIYSTSDSCRLAQSTNFLTDHNKLGRWLLLWAVNGNDDNNNVTVSIDDPDLLLGSSSQQARK